MKWKFVVVGKPSLKYARLGIDEYLKRMRKYVGVELVSVKNGTKEEEGERLLKASENSYRIVFDERGELIDTKTLTEKINELEMDGSCKLVTVLIGGAEGHSAELRSSADLII